MKCPIDGAGLVMSERRGVEIDYCPTCRGVWLDRGELDKILDRAAEQQGPAAGATAGGSSAGASAGPLGGVPRFDDGARHGDATYRYAPDDDRSSGSPRYDERRYDERRGYRRKKESWLSDLLDFD